MSLPISVVVIAKNEEKRIANCLKNVYGWADEIVVINDESVDATVQIAAQYTSKIFHRKMELEGCQRNFGADKSKNDWVLKLDCDELLTEELKQELVREFQNPDPQIASYAIPQLTYLGQIVLKHGGWSSTHLKLYNKKHVRWSEAPYDVVHPGIFTDKGYIQKELTHPYVHYNFSDIEDFIRKINRYSTLEAIKWHLSNRKMPLGKAVWRSVDRFFRRYIGKKGYKDGYYGFAAAVISSFHEIAAYSKYREIKEFKTYLS